MKVYPSKFNTLATANAAIMRRELPSKWQIVLGDDMLFWVVTAREASFLCKNGLELAQ